MMMTSYGVPTVINVTRRIVSSFVSRRKLSPCLAIKNHALSMGSMTSQSCRFYQELAYAERGDPVEKLGYNCSAAAEFVPDLSPFLLESYKHDDWILVELLAAPVNPADLNVVEGKYPSPHQSDGSHNHQPPRPVSTSYLDSEPQCHVGGAEAIGRVLQVRQNNYNEAKGDAATAPLSPCLAVGDTVVLGESGFGTWRSHLWVPSRSLLRVPTDLMQRVESNEDGNGLTLAQVALLSQVAGTAYRLLRDFGSIQAGDVVIQNAGTSAVSMCVAELMRIFFPSSHLISFVRRHEEEDEWPGLVNLLTRGRTTNHTIVSEDRALATANDRQAWRDWKEQVVSRRRVVLGLNSVHGPQTSQLFFSLLSDNARLVTYGAMSRQALPVPAAPLIFRNISVCGYWHSRWMVSNREAWRQGEACPRQEMLNQLSKSVVEDNLLLPPVHIVDLSQASKGLKEIFDQVPTKPLRSKLVWNLQK